MCFFTRLEIDNWEYTSKNFQYLGNVELMNGQWSFDQLWTSVHSKNEMCYTTNHIHFMHFRLVSSNFIWVRSTQDTQELNDPLWLFRMHKLMVSRYTLMPFDFGSIFVKCRLTQCEVFSLSITKITGNHRKWQEKKYFGIPIARSMEIRMIGETLKMDQYCGNGID